MTIAGIPLIELIRQPWRRYLVSSPLPRELLVRRLQQAVQPRVWFRRSPSREQFEGEVTADGFRIRRQGAANLIYNRRGLHLVIVGRFEPSAYGTRVHITFRPVMFELVLRALAICAVASIAVAGVIRHLEGRRGLAVIPAVLAVIAMFYLSATVMVAIQARKTKPLLDQLFAEAAAASSTRATP